MTRLKALVEADFDFVKAFGDLGADVTLDPKTSAAIEAEKLQGAIQVVMDFLHTKLGGFVPPRQITLIDVVEVARLIKKNRNLL